MKEINNKDSDDEFYEKLLIVVILFVFIPCVFTRLLMFSYDNIDNIILRFLSIIIIVLLFYFACYKIVLYMIKNY